MRYIAYIATLIILFAALAVKAQDSLEVDSFVIVKEYVPTLSQAPKIKINPEITDSQKVDMNVKYDLLDASIPHDFNPEPIKAATLKGEPLVRLHRNYLILGYGTNAMPLGEFYFGQLRSKKTSYNIHGKHFSSSGISSIDNSNFSENNLGFAWSRYSRKFTLSTKADYNYNAVNYYGYNQASPYYQSGVTDLNQDALQFYNRFSASMSFENNQRDTSGLRHRSELGYQYVSDRFGTKESRLLLTGETSLHHNELYTFDWGVDYLRLTDGNRLAGSVYQFSNSDTLSLNNTIVYAEPGIDLRSGKWSLQAAARLAGEFGEKSSVYVYPKADFRFNLVKDIIVPYAGISGDLKRNSYGMFTKENPFVNSALPLLNSNETFRFYAGIRGHLSKNTSFNASLSRASVKNLPLYVKDTNTYEQRTFNVIYDKATITKIQAELTYEPLERWRFVLNGRYFMYDMDREMEAWHRPNYRISALTSYMLGNKIKAEVLVYLIGNQKALRYVNSLPVDETIKGTTDINLNLEYRYSKKIGLFLDFNNLASIKYQRYQDYPTLGFNFMGGFRFSF